MRRYLEAVTLLCLGIWVGSMTGFAMVAPQLFAAFGTERQRAGDLAGAIIWRINTVGMVLGFIALAALLPRLAGAVAKWRLGLLAGSLALALVGAFYIFPQMDKARPNVPIEQLSLTDPVRVKYDHWHKLSEKIFGAAMFLGAGVILLGPFTREER